TKSDAYSIAKQFQHLVGRKYKVTEEDDKTHAILYIIPAPYATEKQIKFAQLFTLYVNGDGLLQHAIDYLQSSEDEDFEVLLVAITQGAYKMDVILKPLSVVSMEDTLVHGFNILLV